ncbi:hypothetical protein [Pseudomonas grimontii]|uniref:Uncharacterized protein n=1 Tax=Pseudomonas grimontii TaxID=129847 RepID=A0A5C5PKN7_9PSED|nr:hypothetical protein [Pseudomonas grimontii]TWR67291.1 hypothetical protein FIV39_11410 [Pseudomonas grimontii]
MSLAVDRPYPVDFVHRGVAAKIAPQWGDSVNTIPVGVAIHIDHANYKGLAIVEKAQYSSYEAAIDRGREVAKDRIDHALGSNS